jgi:hypothetical protein
MRMPLVHTRGGDRPDPLVGQLGRREAAATPLEGRREQIDGKLFDNAGNAISS